MKRTLISVLFVLYVLSLTSCGGGGGDSYNKPIDISGSWYGEGYFEGYPFQIGYAFSYLEGNYYNFSGFMKIPGIAKQSFSGVVKYDHPDIVSKSSQDGQPTRFATVTSSSTMIVDASSTESGVNISNIITLYRQ